MERGEPLAETPTLDATLDRLLANTDDAYTFPPFASLAPLIRIGGEDYDALRARERSLLSAAVEPAWRVRIRVRGHNWSDLIPTLVADKVATLELGGTRSKTRRRWAIRCRASGGAGRHGDALGRESCRANSSRRPLAASGSRSGRPLSSGSWASRSLRSCYALFLSSSAEA